MANQVISRADAKKFPPKESRRTTIASLSGMTSDSNLSKRIMHNNSALKNAKGDNSQVFFKKDSSSLTQKFRKRKKDSLKRGDKYSREETSLKLVPLHINDVLDALKHAKKTSITALVQSSNKIKVECLEADTFSTTKSNNFHYGEQLEIRDIGHKRQIQRNNIITDYIDDLNIKHIGRCESEMRKSKKMKRRKPIGNYGPKKWSQALIRESMKFSEKSFPLSKSKEIKAESQMTKLEVKEDLHNTRHDSRKISVSPVRRIRSQNFMSDNKSDGQSSLTLLTLIPPHQSDNTDQIEIQQIKTARRRLENHSNRKYWSSTNRRKEKRHLDSSDEKNKRNSFHFSDTNHRKGRKIHSKSYTAYKDKDNQSFVDKDKKSFVNHERLRTMYISKSQESNAYKTPTIKHKKKSRIYDHSRKEKLLRRERHRDMKHDSQPLVEDEHDEVHMRQKIIHRTENDYKTNETRSSEKPKAERVRKHRMKRPYKKYEKASWTRISNAAQNHASKKLSSSDEKSEKNYGNNCSEKSYNYSEKAYSHNYSEKNYQNYSEKSYQNTYSDLNYQNNYSDINCQNNYSSELNYQANFSDNLQNNLSEKNFYENSYQRMVMSNSDIQNEVNKDAENSYELEKVVDSKTVTDTNIITETNNQDKQEEKKSEVEKESKTNESTQTSDTNEKILIEQSSNIILREDFSQNQKMHITVSDTLYFLKGSKNYLEKSMEGLPTDSCSVDIIPSETFNVRYRKNRLNGNMGLMSRISVPDFYQSPINNTNTRTLRRNSRVKSRILQNSNSSEYLPSNDPLRNMLLTRLVRQNSTISLIEEPPRAEITIKKSLPRHAIELKKSLPRHEISLKKSLPKQEITANSSFTIETDIESYNHLLMLPPSVPIPALPAISEPVSATNIETASPEINSDGKKPSIKKISAKKKSESDLNSSETTIATRSASTRRKSKSRKLKTSKSSKSKKSSAVRDSSDDNSSDNEKYYQRSGHACHSHKKSRRINSPKSKSTVRSQPRSLRKEKTKTSGEKRSKKGAQQKSDSSNDESGDCPYHYSRQNDKSSANLHKNQNKKCAVENCNKKAVDEIEQLVARSKQLHTDLCQSRCCHHANNSDEKEDKMKCTHRGENDREEMTRKKNCISCTVPLTERNTVGSHYSTKPGNKQHILTGENLALQDKVCLDENGLPFFKSTAIKNSSLENFQQLVPRTRPCTSSVHRKNFKFSPSAKKYHSQPSAKLFVPNHAPVPYNTSTPCWEPEINIHTSHSIQCRMKKQGCAYHSLGNNDNLDFYCDENNPMIEQQVDYPTVTPPGMSFEPFPFMQLNNGPLTDTNGRPLLILDEEGHPILDYDGDPITPDTYAQTNEEYEFNSGFRIMCENSAIKAEKTQVKKFSRFIPGFIKPVCQYEVE